MRRARNRLLILLASTAVAVLVPRAVDADWHLTPLVGYTFGGDTTIVYAAQRHWHFGGAASLVGEGPLGVEGVFLYTPGLFGAEEQVLVTSSRSLAVMGNLFVTVPRRWSELGLRPFVSGGFGLMRASVSDLVPGALPVQENLFGYNIGGGAVGFVTDRTGLRFDLRRFSGRGAEESLGAFGPVRLTYWTATTGVVFRF